MKLRVLLLTLLCSLAAPTAFAQTNDNAQVMDRMDRMDHDLMLLQKQVSQGGSSSGNSSNLTPLTDAPTGSAAGQLEVRLSAIEEELRSLRGRVEENDFQTKKVSDALAKFQKDVDYRFNELSTKPPVAAATPAAPDTETKAARKPLPSTTDAGSADADEGTLKPPADAETAEAKTTFASPREHYNYAFRLLNQTQYDQAAKSFNDFSKKYPKDPLIGNAYYWEGETFYIRHDFVNAADNFRQGFEAMPDGPKAADNLLKLAMSLDALGRDKEACVVLQQIGAKFKKSSSNTVAKAATEQQRIGCQ